MAINIFKRIILILAIYIIIIFGILFLQFTNDSGFFLSINGLKISGSEKINEQTGAKTPELPIFISAKGIDFFVDNENPLVAVNSDGTSFKAVPLSFVKAENSFSIKFDQGISLTFFPAEVNSTGNNKKEDAAGVIISAEIPEDISEIQLKYNLATGVRFETLRDILMLRVEKNLYYLTGAVFDTGREGDSPPVSSNISIKRESPMVVYEKYEPFQEASLAEINADPASSEEAYLKAVQTFYTGIAPLYKTSAGADSLSESLVAAYISESGKNGTYQQAVTSIPASFTSGGNRSYITSVYVNDLERNWLKRMESINTEINIYTGELSAGNPAVFEKKDLVSFLIENKRGGDFPSLVTLATKSVDSGQITARQAAGIIEISMDKNLLKQGTPNIGNEVLRLCEEKIRKSLQYIKHSDTQGKSSLYLIRDDKMVDSRVTLETAGILYRYGSETIEKKEWLAVGRLLTSTILNMFADRNTIPKIFAVSELQQDSNGDSSFSDGTMSMSEIYPYVEPLQTWYPHMEILTPYCIWTCALSVDITSPEKNVIDITARFPAGSTHYMVITDIPRFNRIQIYGIDFRSDPRFETYNSSGYKYDSETKTLYLKMRHKNEYETVRLFTGTARPPAAQPASAPEQETSGSQPQPVQEQPAAVAN